MVPLALLLVLAALLSPARATPLHEAVLSSDVEAVGAYLAANRGGADAVDKRGMTALVLAVHQRVKSPKHASESLEIIEALLDAGAIPTTESTISLSSKLMGTCMARTTALPYDLNYGLRRISPVVLASLCGADDALGAFLGRARGEGGDAAAAVLADTGSWMPPLHAAALSGHVGVIEALLVAGASPGRMHPGGRRSALHVAAAVGNDRAVLALVQGGGNVDVSNTEGVTPLMAAVFYANQDAVKVLVEAGSDVRATLTLAGWWFGQDVSLNAVEIAIGMRFLETSSHDYGMIEHHLEAAIGSPAELDAFRNRRELLMKASTSELMEAKMMVTLPGHELDEKGNPKGGQGAAAGGKEEL